VGEPNFSAHFVIDDVVTASIVTANIIAWKIIESEIIPVSLSQDWSLEWSLNYGCISSASSLAIMCAHPGRCGAASLWRTSGCSQSDDRTNG
jgi:hypothetical protein